MMRPATRNLFAHASAWRRTVAGAVAVGFLAVAVSVDLLHTHGPLGHAGPCGHGATCRARGDPDLRASRGQTGIAQDTRRCLACRLLRTLKSSETPALPVIESTSPWVAPRTDPPVDAPTAPPVGLRRSRAPPAASSLA